MAKRTAAVAPDFGDGPRPKRYPNTRPRSAASIILTDISKGYPRFLMGQRSEGHVFMPGFYVFPGGRLERRDYRSPSPLAVCDREKLARTTSPNLGGALANCALREMTEETGLVADKSAPLRYIARAITPPGQIRRYDTRFFLAQASAESLGPPHAADGEFLRVDWFDPNELEKDRIHRITALILEAALTRLRDDPKLDRELPTPVHRFRHGKPVMEME